MNHGSKLSNCYQQAFGKLYANTPKAVFAALVYSYTSAGGDYPEKAIQNFLNEWQILYDQEIIPQRPPKYELNKTSTESN